MIAPEADPVGAGVIEEMAGLGFDYIELSLAHIAKLSGTEFSRLAGRIERSGLRCEACNNFFPAEIRLTGPEADPAAALEYAAHAMGRAARLDARVIVFGSSGAKNVPPGFPRDQAWGQIAALLERLAPEAERHRLTIAIEPISRGESNIVNLAAEGLRLAREVARPAVQLLVDYYHLMTEGEDPAILMEAGGALHHVHLARAEGRAFPTAPEPALLRFFDCLRAVGYSGRCSIEARTADFSSDARRALEVLRAAAGAQGSVSGPEQGATQ
jgi:sugar phosphate isomerase/epimerase